MQRFMKLMGILFLICMTLLPFSGCSNTQNTKISCTGKVIEINEFGNAVTDIKKEDFEANGFSLGDQLSVSFSGGYENADMPFYNSFYGENGDLIVVNHVSHYDNISFASVSDSFSEKTGVLVGEEVTIKQANKGAYSEIMDLYYLPSAQERWDGQSDSQFANFRNMTCGQLKAGWIYRSASPVDPDYKRTEIIPPLIVENNINFIIDMADDEEDFLSYSPYPKDLINYIEEGKIYLCAFSTDYADEETSAAIANICRIINDETGPYLLHCSLGQDRTGFVCTVFEGLCGATYQEIIDDYMLSYSNLYGFTKTSDPKKYDLMMKRVIDMLKITTGAEDPSKLSQPELESAIKNYLKTIGLNEAEITTMRGKLCE